MYHRPQKGEKIDSVCNKLKTDIHNPVRASKKYCVNTGR